MTTVELTPKSKKSEFKKVTLVVSGNAIVALEWVDQLNQSTQVRLDHWDPSSTIEPQRFEFVVPADVDVVGRPR
jgi:outer membrane lipoprotein-sorting protein